MQSPVAVILSYPMTIYYILTTCLKDDEPELFRQLQDGGPLYVHLLGVEKEVEMKEAFLTSTLGKKRTFDCQFTVDFIMKWTCQFLM